MFKEVRRGATFAGSGNAWRSRGLMALIALAGLIAVSPTVAGDAQQTYLHGQIVKITTESRAESGTGGPQPPQQEDGVPPQPSTPDYGTVTYVRLRSGGQIYAGRLAAGVEPQSLAEFAPGEPVEFRLCDGKLYLQRSNGAEIELTLIRD